MRPSMRGESRSMSIVFVGRLPGKVRCGTSHSGVPSARTSSGVLPNASASPWARMFAIRMSWCSPPSFEPTACRGCAKAMRSQGTGEVPWWIIW